MDNHYTLTCLKDKGDDSKWSVYGYGPIVYLTCSRKIAEFICASLNASFQLYRRG